MRCNDCCFLACKSFIKELASVTKVVAFDELFDVGQGDLLQLIEKVCYLLIPKTFDEDLEGYVLDVPFAFD